MEIDSDAEETGNSDPVLLENRRPQQTDNANRMVSIAGDIFSTELAACASRRPKIFIILEQEAGEIIQQDHGQHRTDAERSDPQLDQIPKSVLF
ncbi:hypothetical protein AYI69_g8285 [Smittium culicis]|uniref:Uncharacterized protein n=1 Tax=Smittium culicis TaxID=133412 RepID=A0A1R1XKM0_9FUNG|nr:hypothetical protein AYI69_g8285 [Smittium culicis]